MSAQGQTGPTTQDEALERACLEGLIDTPHGWRYRPSKGAAAVLAAGYLSPAEVERQITAARAQALRDAADEIYQVGSISAGVPVWRVEIADWLRDRADTEGNR